MKMLRALLLVLFCFSLSGCAAFAKALPQIVSLVTDAVLVVQQIEGFTDGYFRAHPDPKREADVADALARARHALIAVERAAAAGEALSSENYLAALGAFREAYEALLVACSGMPGLRVVKGTEDAVAGPGEVVVPEPMLLAHQMGG